MTRRARAVAVGAAAGLVVAVVGVGVTHAEAPNRTESTGGQSIACSAEGGGGVTAIATQDASRCLPESTVVPTNPEPLPLPAGSASGPSDHSLRLPGTASPTEAASPGSTGEAVGVEQSQSLGMSALGGGDSTGVAGTVSAPAPVSSSSAGASVSVSVPGVSHPELTARPTASVSNSDLPPAVAGPVRERAGAASVTVIGSSVTVSTPGVSVTGGPAGLAVVVGVQHG